ncbi:Rnase E [Gordonia phage Bakery]|uniref:Helix-turn-helix DNA binding domain protein n=1 Tax=Gordonia phage Bakery TaxID=2591205 RepID=A0A514DGN5_9CAUD|nr:Rnase E [Gordonia phage Bakery]QDH92786.1 helix-turn-helix DNA binding domain protein [Gordonia phage Bakery]
MGDAKTSVRYQNAIMEREARCLELFLAGAKYVHIAKEVGFREPQSARRAIERAIARRRQERDDLADEASTIMLDQLDMLYRAHITTALDRKNPDQYKATEQVLRVLDRKAKLQGINAPVQVETTVRVKDELDDEIATLVRKLKEQGDPALLPDTPVLDSIIDAQVVDDPAAEGVEA